MSDLAQAVIYMVNVTSQMQPDDQLREVSRRLDNWFTSRQLILKPAPGAGRRKGHQSPTGN